MNTIDPVLYEELVALARAIAAWKICDEARAECESDSGPYCSTHGDNFLHVDQIETARTLIKKADGR